MQPLAAAASLSGPSLQPNAGGPPSSPLPLVCRCRGRGDGVFQIGDGGPEAVAANSLEQPGSWQRPRDLCGPRPAEWHQVTFPTPTPLHPTPQPLSRAGMEGDTSDAVMIGLKGRTHDWLQEETFLFLNLDQWKTFIFISDSYFFKNLRLGIWLPRKLSELWCFI